jgi:ribosome recycling factor
MSDETIQGATGDMARAIEQLKRELIGVRTGRATPALIEHLPVEVASYGSTMQMKELGGITAPDARLLVVNPWDKGTIKDIERAIATSGLGFNPQSDGQIVRIPIPALTGERRQQLVKVVKQHAEDAKVRVRAVRREYKELLEAMQDDGDLTEDQLKRALEKLQEHTDSHVKLVDEVCARKEKEILDV